MNVDRFLTAVERYKSVVERFATVVILLAASGNRRTGEL